MALLWLKLMKQAKGKINNITRHIEGRNVISQCYVT